MKKSFMKKMYAPGLALLSFFLISACKDDVPETPKDPEPAEISYGISTVSGAWPDLTTYIQGVKDLNSPSVGNENAIELTGSANTISYNGSIYATPFEAPAKLVKYSIDDKGIPQHEETIVVPGANTFSTIYFKSESVAYGTVAGGISKLIVFNPATMRITDEISLSMITKRIPEATRTYYLDMRERDNKLFMGVFYENNFKPVNDSAYIAVIDLNTNTVEKIIADGRTGMVFGGQAPNAGMFKAASGDIYVQCLGTLKDGGKSPAGLLKIKAGTTTFDEDYFFNLQEATGSICFGIYHVNGKTFNARVEDETDFWEYLTGKPQFKYYEIDPESKTSLGAVPGLPVTYGSRRMIVQPLDGQNLLFSIATNDENAVYKLDLGTNTSSKLFVSTGGYITGLQNIKRSEGNATGN